VEASTLAKRRLKAILEQIGGNLTVEQACTAMGVGESVFYELRAAVLEAAAQSLEPGRPGRPRRQLDEHDERLEALEDEMQLTRIELQAARLREEIAVSMPHVLRHPRQTKKKR
jgi:transposase